ncbi:hypothetical protein Y5S_03532 [Alcanivorax nanhaiticus]|uniref:DUF2505 domain-containing protein n=1 Tax=Alcanivorax nanhaiticus TaxID=1177154 RepID=A0A095SFC4_9GAMM|nr:DUF2505 domain-containing protein [Alcanivorax nanhaiticus]KGD63257.1 hypothetical protein Y5S_03532 [Alcanivorax nanhaiticus]
MKVKVDREYPVSVEKLYEIITSKDFFEQRFQWGKVNDYRFEGFEQTAEGLLLKIFQPVKFRSDKIPGFARRFLPEQADLLTEFLWTPLGDGSGYQARYRFQLGNVPVTVAGKMVLSRDGEDHAIQCTEVEVSSSVPIVGKKLVALLADKVDDALAGDYRQTLRYVQERC